MWEIMLTLMGLLVGNIAIQGDDLCDTGVVEGIAADVRYVIEFYLCNLF